MSYEAMLADYQNSQNSTTQTSFSSEDNLKNYFSTWMPDSVKQKQFRVRILPDADGGSPFKLMKIHSLEVNGKYPKFLCPKETNGEECPFCEAKALLMKGDAASKKLSNTYNLRDMHVVKLIDREREAEGVKFWRFAKNYKNQGVMDKIMDVVMAMGPTISIDDPATGFDLLISVKRDTQGIPGVNSIMAVPTGSTVLSEDPTIAQEWLSDERTWKDVYKSKTYEFMEITLNGDTPVYDKEKKIYVVSGTETTGETNKESVDNDINKLVQDQRDNNFNTPEEVISGKGGNTVTASEDFDDVPF